MCCFSYRLKDLILVHWFKSPTKLAITFYICKNVIKNVKMPKTEKNKMATQRTALKKPELHTSWRIGNKVCSCITHHGKTVCWFTFWPSGWEDLRVIKNREEYFSFRHDSIFRGCTVQTTHALTHRHEYTHVRALGKNALAHQNEKYLFSFVYFYISFNFITFNNGVYQRNL